MPIQTVSQLTKTTTRAEALTFLLDLLKSFGFATQSWESGSIQRSLVELGAAVWSQSSGVVAFIARGGFNQLATGEALTQFSDSAYDNQRGIATATQGKMLLTETAAGGPYVIAAGDMVAVDASTGGTFRNTTGGTLNPSSTLLLEFAAEVAGESGNIPTGTGLTLQVTIAGVAITNPAIGTTGTWITSYGVNAESDVVLRQRNRSKWPSLSVNKPGDAYIQLALRATNPGTIVPTGITKVAVNSGNPAGEGSLDVYIANDLTTASATQLTNVNTYLQARRAVSSILATKAANVSLMTVSGTVFYRSGASLDTVGAAVQAAVTALLTSLPIEGVQYAPASKGLALSELSGAITAVTDVLNVTLTSPSTDVSLGGTWALLVLSAPVWQAGGPNTLTFTAI